jgi:hypothetical protein
MRKGLDHYKDVTRYCFRLAMAAQAEKLGRTQIPVVGKEYLLGEVCERKKAMGDGVRVAHPFLIAYLNSKFKLLVVPSLRYKDNLLQVNFQAACVCQVV